MDSAETARARLTMAIEDPAEGPRAMLPGEGNIRAKTLRLGHVILPVEAIESISITVKPRNIWPIIYAGVLIGAIVAFAVHGINLDYLMSGSVFLIIVGAGVAIALRWPARSVLAIGTTGGRTFYVGARNKEFLIRLGELLRRKIDTGDPGLTGEFSAENNLVSAALAPGSLAAPERIPALRKVE
jgi:hypothetical protein